MKAIGIVLIVLGAVTLLVGFGMDGSVANAAYDRVNNIGLLNLKSMLVTAGGAVIVAGSVFVGAAEVASTLIPKVASPQSADADQRTGGSAQTEPDPSAGRGEAWRKTHTVIRSTRTGGKRIYFLDDDTVAVEGLNRTFPDVRTALEGANG